MDIINNRFRIIDFIKDKDMLVVHDLAENNLAKEMKIVDRKSIPAHIMEYLKEEFIAISSIKSPYHIKSYNFGVVYQIDGKPEARGKTLLTRERIEDLKEILDSLQENYSLKRVFTAIGQVLEGIHYMNNGGYVYNDFNPKRIYNSGRDINIKFHDVVGLKLEEKDGEAAYISDIRQFDYKRLSHLLLSIVLVREFDQYDLEIKKIRENPEKLVGKDEKGSLNKLLDFIDQLGEEQGKEDGLYDALLKFSEIANYTLGAGLKHNDIKIQIRPKLVSRKPELKSILDKVLHRDGKKIIGIKAEKGIGKTRFLQDIDFYLKIEGIEALTIFEPSTKESQDEIMDDFMHKIFSLYDDEAINKFKKEEEEEFGILNHSALYFLETEDGPNKRYVKSIEIAREKLFSKYKSRSAIFLIDDLDEKNQVFKDCLEMINDTQSMDISFIFTFKDAEKISKMALEYEEYRLKSLRKQESKELIKNILIIDKLDESFTKIIHEKTKGNPFLINETIKGMVIKGVLKKDARARIIINEEKAKEFLQGEINSTRLAQETYANLEEGLISILRLFAVFSRGIFKADISFLRQTKYGRQDEVEKLLDLGIIYPIYNYGMRKFYLFNLELRKLIYNDMSEKERNLLHMQILSSFNDDKIYHKRSLYHLKKLKSFDRYIDLSLELSQKSRIKKDLDSSIQFKKLALEEISSPLRRAVIIYQLIQDYNNFEAYEKIEEISKEIKDSDKNKEILAYKMLAGYAAEKNKSRIKFEGKFPISEKENPFIFAEYLRYKGIKLYKDGKYEEAQEIFKQVISLAKNNSGLEITHAITLKEYANTKFLISESQTDYKGYLEASKLYDEAAKLASSIGEVSTILGALSNSAACKYKMSDYDGAKHIYEETLRLGKIYGIKTIVLISRLNLTYIYQAKNKLDESLETIKEALKLVDDKGVNPLKYGVYIGAANILLSMNRLSDMRTYMDKAFSMIKEGEVDEGSAHLYYKNEALYYFSIGNYEKALLNHLKQSELIDRLDLAVAGDKEFSEKVLKIMSNKCYSMEGLIQSLRTILKNKYICYNLNFSNFFRFLQKVYMKQNSTGKELIINELIQHSQNIELFIENGFLNIEAQAYFCYFKALQNMDKETNLFASIAKFHESPYSLQNIFVINELAKLYVEQGEIDFGKFVLLEAINSIRYFLEGVDEEYVDKLIEANDFKKTFKFFESLENKLEIDEISIGMEDILKKDYSKCEKSIKIKRAAKEYFKRHMGNFVSEKDFLDKISTEPDKNIKLLIDRVASKTLASNVFLLVWEEGELILHTKRHATCQEKFNKELLDKVQNLESFEIRKKGRIVRKKYLSFPVDEGKTGYLLIEFNRFIVNNDEKSINYIRKILGFLDMLVKAQADRKAVYIDKLTGAMSRKRFQEIARNMIDNAMKEDYPISFAILDIDRFKRVNDTYGHSVGDVVLRKVAQTAIANIEDNPLGRIGGEEFMILLPNFDKNAAFDYVEKLRETISNISFDDIEEGLKITISLGVSEFPKDGKSYNDLYEKADRAMYVSKNSGRNKTTIYEEGITENTTGQDDIQGILRADDLERLRNVRTIVENLKISVSNLSPEEKAIKQLRGIMEAMMAEEISLVFLDGRENIYINQDKTKEQSPLNKHLISQVVKLREPTFAINRDRSRSSLVKIPEWTSVLVTPVLYFGEIKGVLYIKSQARIKEYQENDLSLIESLSAILAKEL